MSSEPMNDLFKILGVSRDCTSKDVRKAFMTDALKWHPDRATEQEKESFEKKYDLLKHAYKILSNDNSRKQYEASLCNTMYDLRENVERYQGYYPVSKEYIKEDEDGKTTFNREEFLNKFNDNNNGAVDTNTKEKTVTNNDYEDYLKKRAGEINSTNKPKLDPTKDSNDFNNAFNAAFIKLKKEEEQNKDLVEYEEPSSFSFSSGSLTEFSHGATGLLTGNEEISTSQIISGIFTNPQALDLTTPIENKSEPEAKLTGKDILSKVKDVLKDRDALLYMDKSKYDTSQSEIEKQYPDLFEEKVVPIEGVLEASVNTEETTQTEETTLVPPKEETALVPPEEETTLVPPTEETTSVPPETTPTEN